MPTHHRSAASDKSSDARPSTTRQPEPSKAQQSGWRPLGIGGSDIGAILGVSPYRSAVDVWLDKVNTGSPAPRQALPMRLGNFLAPFVVQEYERLTTNTTRRHDLTLHHPEYPELFGHVDSETKPDGYEAVLECKTCSAFRASEWGPA